MKNTKVTYSLKDLTEDQAKEKGDVLYKAWKHYIAKQKIFEIISKNA